MKKSILFIILFSLFSASSAQQFTPYGLKFALIFKFASYIQWENEKNLEKFRIGVFDSDTLLFSEFSNISNNKFLKSKSIEIVKFRDVSSIKDIQLFFLNEKNLDKAESIFNWIKGKSILLVTDNYSEKKYILINFIAPTESNQQFNFEINTKNITDNNLTILPELLLLGGSEIEKRNLFYNIQDSLKSEQLRVQQQKMLLDKQQLDLAIQDVKILEQQVLIERQNESIIEQQQRIISQKTNLNELTSEVSKQQNLLKSKLGLLKKTEEYLKHQEQKTKEQEIQIEQHAKTLKLQVDQIEEQKYLYEEQKKNLNLKTSTIKKQEYTIYLIVIILLLVTLYSANIFKNYKQKKRINKELEDRNLAIIKQNNEIQSQKEEIQKQTQELILKNNKLLELDQFKQGMTSMIVHDMKNSLNAILNAPERYSDEEKLALNKQYGQQMLHLVLNILDVHKYEDTKMVVQQKKVDLFHLSCRAVKQVDFLAKQKKIRILNKIDENSFVVADEEIVERVFVNLLTNAIKYSKSSSKVQIEADISINQNILKVKIVDSGMGIPNEKRHLVFQKFGQVEEKKSGGVRSTGIGLTFCKMAIEAHGGEIDFTSVPDKGSTFWFTLQSCTNHKYDSENKVTVKADRKHTISLSEQDKIYLSSFIMKLKTHKIYEISSIDEIILSIEERSETIKMWKKELREIIDNFDKERFAYFFQKSTSN